MIEVLVVVVVLGLLVSISAPLMLKTRESSKAQTCQFRLKTLALGLHTYHETYAKLPPAAVWSTDVATSLALHRAKRIDLITHQNCAQLLLSFVGEEDLSSQIDLSSPIGAESNSSVRITQMKLISCPSDEFNHDQNRYRFQPSERGNGVEFARGNYAINGGTNNLESITTGRAGSMRKAPKRGHWFELELVNVE